MSFAARGEARDMEFATTRKQRYIKALVPPQRRSPFQRFFRFPALADGAFQVLGLFKSADD